MQHEAVAAELAAVLRELDSRYGAGNYTIVAPYRREFRWLRLAHPDHHSVSAQSDDAEERPGDRIWNEYFGPQHVVGSLAALERQPRPWVYFGADADFAPRDPATRPSFTSSVASSAWAAQPARHPVRARYTASWVYRDPRLVRVLLLRNGHYRAEELSPLP